ncbi:MAG: hypothetical protein K1X88_12450 [Nannocystaceae bacterium]|nr:hypothetical protein [Nannocystaceae bacterium]
MMLEPRRARAIVSTCRIGGVLGLLTLATGCRTPADPAPAAPAPAKAEPAQTEASPPASKADGGATATAPKSKADKFSVRGPVSSSSEPVDHAAALGLDASCTYRPQLVATEVPPAFFAAIAARDTCALRRLIKAPFTVFPPPAGSPGLAERCRGEARDAATLLARFECLVDDVSGRGLDPDAARVVPPVAVLPEMRDAFSDPALVYVNAKARGKSGVTSCTFAIVETAGLAHVLGVTCTFMPPESGR